MNTAEACRDAQAVEAVKGTSILRIQDVAELNELGAGMAGGHRGMIAGLDAAPDDVGAFQVPDGLMIERGRPGATPRLKRRARTLRARAIRDVPWFVFHNEKLNGGDRNGRDRVMTGLCRIPIPSRHTSASIGWIF